MINGCDVFLSASFFCTYYFSGIRTGVREGTKDEEEDEREECIEVRRRLGGMGNGV